MRTLWWRFKKLAPDALKGKSVFFSGGDSVPVREPPHLLVRSLLVEPCAEAEVWAYLVDGFSVLFRLRLFVVYQFLSVHLKDGTRVFLPLKRSADCPAKVVAMYVSIVGNLY